MRAYEIISLLFIIVCALVLWWDMREAEKEREEQDRLRILREVGKQPMTHLEEGERKEIDFCGGREISREQEIIERL